MISLSNLRAKWENIGGKSKTALVLALLSLILAVSTACGVFSNVPVPVLPASYRYLPPLDPAQFETLVEKYPYALAKVYIFPTLGKVVVVPVSPEGRPALVSQVNTGELFDKLKKKNISFETRDAEVDTSFLGNVDTVWFFFVFILISGWGGLGYVWFAHRNEEVEVDTGLEAVPRGATFSGGSLSIRQRGERPAPKAFVPAPDDAVSFDDVAGCPEAKEQLLRLLKFLDNFVWFTLCKGKLPKGIVLKGPPGTGKTLLARALASAGKLNVFSISAGELEEELVGVGARRLRDLNRAAHEAFLNNGNLSLIIVDEIDVIGKANGRHGQGYDETLGQLLSLLDGPVRYPGVIWLGTTNRLDLMAEALLRPGRFEYHVEVEKPTIAGLEELLTVYRRGLSFEEGIDWREMARMIAGLTGAHVAFIMNEAKLVMAERLLPQALAVGTENMESIERIITRGDMLQAIEFARFGKPLESRWKAMSDDEKRVVAEHEAGHTAVAMHLREEGQPIDPVSQVTIMPRMDFLGAMISFAERDHNARNQAYLEAAITKSLGGRASELVIGGMPYSGVEGDLDNAGRLARLMVGRFGMSNEFGPISIPLNDQGFPAGDLGDLATEFNNCWRAIVKERMRMALEIVKQRKLFVELLARALVNEVTVREERLSELWKQAAASSLPENEA